MVDLSQGMVARKEHAKFVVDCARRLCVTVDLNNVNELLEQEISRSQRLAPESRLASNYFDCLSRGDLKELVDSNQFHTSLPPQRSSAEKVDSVLNDSPSDVSKDFQLHTISNHGDEPCERPDIDGNRPPFNSIFINPVNASFDFASGRDCKQASSFISRDIVERMDLLQLITPDQTIRLSWKECDEGKKSRSTRFHVLDPEEMEDDVAFGEGRDRSDREIYSLTDGDELRPPAPEVPDNVRSSDSDVAMEASELRTVVRTGPPVGTEGANPADMSDFIQFSAAFSTRAYFEFASEAEKQRQQKRELGQESWQRDYDAAGVPSAEVDRMGGKRGIT